MSKFGKILGITTGTLCAGVTTFTGVFTAQNPGIIKDYVKGNEIYTSEQMQQVQDSHDNEVIDLNKEIVGLKASYTAVETALNAEKAKVYDLEKSVEDLTLTKTNNEQTIATLTSSNTELQSQVTTLTDEVAEKQTTVNSLTAQVETNNARIAELEAQGEENSEEIANLTSANDNLTAQISGLNADIQSKTVEISNLNTTITAQSTQITNLTNQNTTLNNTISSLNTEIQEYQSQIAELEEQLESLIPQEFEQVETWALNDSLSFYSSASGKYYENLTTSNEVIDSSKYLFNYDGVDYNSIKVTSSVITLYGYDESGVLNTKDIYSSENLFSGSKEITILDGSEISFRFRLWLSSNAVINNNEENAVVVNYILDGSPYYVLQEKGSTIMPISTLPLGTVTSWCSDAEGLNKLSDATIISEDTTVYGIVESLEKLTYSFTFDESDLVNGKSIFVLKNLKSEYESFGSKRYSSSLSKDLSFAVCYLIDGSSFYFKESKSEPLGYSNVTFTGFKITINGVEESVDMSSFVSSNFSIDGYHDDGLNKKYKDKYRFEIGIGCIYLVDISTSTLATDAFISAIEFEVT